MKRISEEDLNKMPENMFKAMKKIMTFWTPFCTFWTPFYTFWTSFCTFLTPFCIFWISFCTFFLTSFFTEFAFFLGFFSLYLGIVAKSKWERSRLPLAMGLIPSLEPSIFTSGLLSSVGGSGVVSMAIGIILAVELGMALALAYDKSL